MNELRSSRNWHLRFGLRLTTALALLAAAGAAANAQSTATATWAAQALNRYRVHADVTYFSATGFDAKLDIYRRRDVDEPQPTLIWFHGGGWIIGSKESAIMSLMPWFEMGWNVVNVEYRLARTALAPAAVEDAQCALRYVAVNAANYGFDIDRLVVGGESAGGHLALAAGLIPESEGFARSCLGGGPLGPEVRLPRVAAIVNWYGIVDVVDILDGPNRQTYAIQWFGSMPDRESIARRVSPIHYVNQESPPVITIQGDADPVVPYQHGQRMREALTEARVPTELVTVSDGGHGGFSPEERVYIYSRISAFLEQQLP